MREALVFGDDTFGVLEEPWVLGGGCLLLGDAAPMPGSGAATCGEAVPGPVEREALVFGDNTFGVLEELWVLGGGCLLLGDAAPMPGNGAATCGEAVPGPVEGFLLSVAEAGVSDSGDVAWGLDEGATAGSSAAALESEGTASTPEKAASDAGNVALADDGVG